MSIDLFPPQLCYAAAPLLLLGSTSCTVGDPVQQPAQIAESQRHEVSGLEIVPLTVKSGEKTHSFKVEIAGTSAEQAQGLMHRTELGPTEGMIFPRTPARPASFWMKNTVISLDIIFVGADGKILNVAANTTPLSLDPVESVGPTSLVFEIAGGRAAELGIKAGDLVEWQQ